MPSFTFSCHAADGSQSATRMADLASETEACVLSFNLMQDNPQFQVIKVWNRRGPLFTRTRGHEAGKSDVVWLRARALSA